MILEIEGVVIPDCYKLHSYTNAPVKDGVLFAHAPKWVMPLGKAGWPSDVVDRIAEVFASRGLPKPLETKLVEPYAIIFGGEYLDDERDLSSVNWEMVVDYFTWEAHAQGGQGCYEEARRLQGEAKKKYGGIFSHRGVYDDPKDPNRYY